MNTKFLALREKIKALSKEQKDLRPQRKEKYSGQRKFDRGTAESLMRQNKYELRHLHIAYGLIKGRPYEAIERKVADNNAPSWSYIEKIKQEYTDETVCSVAV